MSSIDDYHDNTYLSKQPIFAARAKPLPRMTRHYKQEFDIDRCHASTTLNIFHLCTLDKQQLFVLQHAS